MLILPSAIIPILAPFSHIFHRRTWMKAQVLLVGAVLVTRKRTVTLALRVTGLSDDTSFARYHYVLNRVEWSSLWLSHVMLSSLIRYLDRGWPTGIRHRRDAVRSSASHFVKAFGLC